MAKHAPPTFRKTVRWTLWGAAGGLAAVLAHHRRAQLLPWVKRALGEAAAFNEWLATGAADLREEANDLWAAARQAAREELSRRQTMEQTEVELKVHAEALERAARGGELPRA